MFFKATRNCTRNSSAIDLVSVPPQTVPDWEAIAALIGAATGSRLGRTRAQSVGGGCTHQAWTLIAGEERYFVKLDLAHRLPVFETEAAALAELARAAAVRAPRSICCGTLAGNAVHVLEYLTLTSPTDATLTRLGHELAALHRVQGSRFGWARDNHIGATPQCNAPSADWAEFWQHRRLGYQLELAGHNGYGGTLQRRGEQLLGRIGALLRDHRPVASLLHGDLWSGNYAADVAGAPVVFDPALYYGDRETDIAMTELFGGFGPGFYAAYRQAWPLESGYPTRRTLYNLYHVLNHLNVFGAGYLHRAERMIDELLSETGH